MPNFEAARIPLTISSDRLTGLPAVDLPIRRDRSGGWGVYVLGSPPSMVGGGRVYRFKPDVDLNDLWKAYLSDGYIQRAVDLLTAMLYHTGVRWSAPSRALDNYLRFRFGLAEVLNGYGWDRLLFTIAFDFILYGNAFLIRAKTNRLKAVYGRSIRTPASACWYPVPARCMFPVVDQAGTGLEGWVLRVKPASKLVGSPVERYFPVEDVVHLAYRRPLDSAYGTPFFLGAVEDIRSLRMVEEEVLRMIHRFVNPRLHISTPDITGTGSGVRPDMQQIVDAINSMSSDSVLVTMPGQDVRIIGAESFALRSDPYLEYFAKRAISGLGMNAVTMGQKDPDPDADTLDLNLRMQIRMAQRALGMELLGRLLLPLVSEAGWDRPALSVEFGEPDTRHLLRLYTIISNLYTQNVITLSEARQLMQLPAAFDEQDSYTWRVQLPRVLEPLKFQLDYGLAGVGGRNGSSDTNPRGRPSKDSPAALKKRDLQGNVS